MSLKQLLKQLLFVEEYRSRKQISEWIEQGHSLPAPHPIKQQLILHYSTSHRLTTLVETGTFLGDMVWAQRRNFKKIYSIELSPDLHQKATKRFRKYPHIQLLQGDSSDRIADVLLELKTPALFWLDGHYSGGITARGKLQCPIYAELSHIFKGGLPHVILIDDARLFVGKDDYPTLDELSAFVHESSAYQFRVINDAIVLTIPEASI